MAQRDWALFFLSLGLIFKLHCLGLRKASASALLLNTLYTRPIAVSLRAWRGWVGWPEGERVEGGGVGEEMGVEGAGLPRVSGARGGLGGLGWGGGTEVIEVACFLFAFLTLLFAGVSEGGG